MDIEKIKLDLTKLIDRAEEISKRSVASLDKRPDEIGIRTSILSYLKNLLGVEHEFYKQFSESTVSGKYIHLKTGVSILRSLKEDIDENWLFNFKQLVAAELFTDYLSMAEHLIEEGYKDAAAVMIGSTLESHLRQLCIKHKINITFISTNEQEKPKKADVLNSELRKEQVYNALDQKQITAWLDLRNKAAHGQYDEYNIDQVRLMYSGVLSFISKTTN
ncbi:MAG: hypothetical protein ACJASQ_001649 [Crocinitomicaceae bacterium]|jgi:hypothetical protein